MEESKYSEARFVPIDTCLYEIFAMDEDENFTQGFNTKKANANMRRVIRHFHPDKMSWNKNTNNEEVTKLITSVWRIIGSPHRELSYRTFGKTIIDDLQISIDWEEVEQVRRVTNEYWDKQREYIKSTSETHKNTPPPPYDKTNDNEQSNGKPEHKTDKETYKRKETPDTSPKKRMRQRKDIFEEMKKTNISGQEKIELIKILKHSCIRGKHIATCLWSNGIERNIDLAKTTEYKNILSEYLNKLAIISPRSFGYLVRDHGYLFEGITIATL